MMRVLYLALFGLFYISQLQPVYAVPLDRAVKAGDVLVFEGDSLTYGQDESPSGTGQPINGAPQRRSAAPFPEYLGMLLGGSVKIVNHGFPGDRTREGLRRWKDAKGGKICFLMYGTNDAGNFGQLPGGSLSVNQFTQNLEAIATRRLSDGAEVVILLPPPAMDPGFDAALQPYREAARDVGGRLDVPVLDTPLVLAPVAQRWVDGIHLSAQSNQAIAAAIKNHIVHYAP